MRQLKAILPVVILSTAAMSASAESGWYLGASVGKSDLGFQSTDEFSNIDIDDSDTGFKVFTGLKFTIAAAEFGYVDFGSVGSDDINVDWRGLSAYGGLCVVLSPVEVCGIEGGFSWNAEADFDSLDEKYDENGFDPSVGIGAAFTLGGMGVRAEYEYFDIGEFDKVSMLSLGATFYIF